MTLWAFGFEAIEVILRQNFKPLWCNVSNTGMKWSWTLDLSFQYLMVFHQIDTVNLFFSFSNYLVIYRLSLFFQEYHQGVKQFCLAWSGSKLLTKQGISADCLFVLLLYVPSQQLWSWRDLSSPNHTFTWASLNKQLTSTLCTYFRL